MDPLPKFREFIRGTSVREIDDQIGRLKDRIRFDQQEIVALSILRAGLMSAERLRTISQRKAREAIDQAIAQVNGDLPAIEVKTNAEGGIK